jgi:hypothetical protein
VAHGVGLIASASVLTGSGPTSFTATSDREARLDAVDRLPEQVLLPGLANTTAQAIGVLGTGTLDDLGGDDSYLVRSHSVHSLTLVATDACGCEGARAAFAPDGVILREFPFAASAAGQSVGNGLFVPDAYSLLADHGGDDVYTTEADVEVSVSAESHVPDSSTGARADSFAVGWAGEASAGGQGLTGGAPGVLIDHQGDDSYLLRANSASEARATAEAGPESARAVAPVSSAWGQGSTLVLPGFGALIDEGGLDSYRAESFSRASASPNPQGAYDLRRSIGAQGSSAGLLADLDEGLDDTFVTSPEPGPGVGNRGEGPGWIDTTYTGGGLGIAPLQPAKADAMLAFDASSPQSANGGIVPFRVSLNGGIGAPLSGREVTFVLEWYVAVIPFEGWAKFDLWSHAFTDEGGTTAGFVDIGAWVDYWTVLGADPADFQLRVTARFAGDESHRPAIATRSFTITK